MQASVPHTLTTNGSNSVVVTHGYLEQEITSFNWNMPFNYFNVAPNGIFINIPSVYGSSADISIQATNKCGQSSFSNPTTFSIIGGYYLEFIPTQRQKP
ncbi:hypothetical protein UMM65_00355 [Aureibaculum sp. 2210JD6-5]|uniref:hypothetical protein n=1 Tax=Aureibaculum sp. 2210JD6-5 TaxID=3103957 RepID=UPI002AAD7F5D|nr:hypothetical protein [Aureibaculum sp. 2210JD6-5]MDY7393680.1 hypothetical protein [Aureibaculum sp. 2210JD6-5]